MGRGCGTPSRWLTPPSPRHCQAAAGEGVRLVRVMPNTPCLVGETASAMCLGGAADDGDAEVVRTLFSAVGVIHQARRANEGGAGRAGWRVGCNGREGTSPPSTHHPPASPTSPPPNT